MKTNLDKLDKLNIISAREQEAIDVLKRLAEEYKDTLLPGLDIMPTKSTYSAMVGAPRVSMTSNEFYKYTLD